MLLLALISCASKAALQEEWDEFVSEHQDCSEDDDCLLVYPGCPIGCVDVISADAASDANDLSIELVSRYDKGGRQCEFECAAYGAAFCDQGTCAISDAATP